MSPISRGPSNSTPATRKNARRNAATPKPTVATMPEMLVPSPPARSDNDESASVSFEDRSASSSVWPISGRWSRERMVSGSCCSRFADSFTSCGPATDRNSPIRTVATESTNTVAQPLPSRVRRLMPLTTGSSAMPRNSATTMIATDVDAMRTALHRSARVSSDTIPTTTLCHARSTCRVAPAAASRSSAIGRA